MPQDEIKEEIQSLYSDLEDETYCSFKGENHESENCENCESEIESVNGRIDHLKEKLSELNFDENWDFMLEYM